MADQSSLTLQKKIDRRAKKLNIAIGLSKSPFDEGNKLGFSGFHDSLDLNKKDSTPIPGSEKIDVNQDHKRRCLEKLVVRREQMTQRNVKDVKCALEVEVIDDTALIEATAAVSRFKNRYRNETGLNLGKNQGNGGGLGNPKDENEGKKKRNKGFKKQGARCSMKCVNEKKSKTQLAEDKSTSEKQTPEGKGKKACRKMPATVKYVYQKKDTKNPKLVAAGVKEHLKVEDHGALEKIGGEAVQETVLNLKDSIGNEKESTIKVVETDVNFKVQIENEKESTIKLVETEAVNEKDDGSKSKLQDDIHIHNEAEDQKNLGSKKSAYSREEMETLRFVDEEGQKTKWAQVYQGFASSVAREYTGLVVDANNRPTQRFNRVVNCGSARHANAILGMPPVLPLCSPSICRKFESYDRV